MTGNILLGTVDLEAASVVIYRVVLGIRQSNGCRNKSCPVVCSPPLDAATAARFRVPCPADSSSLDGPLIIC